MKEQLQNWFNARLAESDLTFDELLWGTMIVALLCASAHLVTMLVTRWGDTKATSKSLVFSALLHMGCIVGLIVFTPPSKISNQIDREEEPIYLSGVVFEEAPVKQEMVSTKLPIWEQFTPPEAPLQERTPQPEREPVTPSEPNRATQQDVFSTYLPNLKTKPEPTNDTPEPDQSKTEQKELAASPVSDQTIPEEINTETPRQPTKPVARLASTNVLPRPENSPERTTSNPVATTTNKVKLSNQIDVLNSEEGIPTPQAEKLKSAPLTNPRELASTSTPDTLKQSEPSPFKNDPTRKPLQRIGSRTNKTTPTGEMALERKNPKNGTQGNKVPQIASTREALPDQETVTPVLEPAIVPRLKAVVPQPQNYQLRNLAKRKENARKNGGTKESEQAVERSLAWLASIQHADGYWDADRYGAGQVRIDENGVDRKQAGKQSDTGLTALTVLAFLGAGYTHEEGQYKTQVEKALRWLVLNQDKNGYLGGRARHFEKMYCHGMVTYALAEACGMQKQISTNSWLRKPIVKGVQYLVAQQNEKDGGWRYLKGQSGDMSMFGWQLMALKSAEISGIATPPMVKRHMIRFLKNRSRGKNNGLASYRESLPPTQSMTAEALFCKQILGINRNNPACVEAVDYMLDNLPSRQNHDLYYWYYGTLSMYQHGNKPWRQWNGRVRDLLVAGQRKTGLYSGSWDPTSVWSPYGGRIYSTVMSTLCLEVYYRFLPLYRANELDAPSAIPE